MSSKVLVTGGTGFIGSRLVKDLTARGFSVRVMMRKTSSDERLRGVSFERVEGDLTDLESLKRAVRGVDVVYHLAAALTEKNPEAYFKRNTQGTLSLLVAIRSQNPGLRRFVFTSSLAAGGPGQPGHPVDETQVPAPVSAYGMSKRRAEEEILKYKDQVSMVILRPPIVYGPADRMILMVLQPLKKGIVPVVRASGGDGKKRYSAIYVGDLVDALIRAGESDLAKVPSGEIFYSTHPEVITFEDIFNTAAETMQKKIRIIPIPFALLNVVGHGAGWLGRVIGKDSPLNSDKVKEIRPDYWVCSGKKAKDLLGFEAKTPFSVGFKETVKWYLEAGWL